VGRFVYRWHVFIHEPADAGHESPRGQRPDAEHDLGLEHKAEFQTEFSDHGHRRVADHSDEAALLAEF